MRMFSPDHKAVLDVLECMENLNIHDACAKEIWSADKTHMENGCMASKTTKVCILRSNPVKPDSRVEKEAWALAKAGYDVHILGWERDSDIPECRVFVEVANIQIPITRLGHKATYGEGMKNLQAYLAFQFHMRQWLKKHDFDIVHACDFHTAFFSIGVAKRKSSKFVFDIFDFLYGEPKGLLQRIVKNVQLKIIDRADATIICTEERRNQISGSTPKKLAVIHNTPSAAQFKQCERKTKQTERAKLVYVGVFPNTRLLKEIAEAVSELPHVELHIGGFGRLETFFKDMAGRFDNIFYYGRLSYDQTLSLETECDIMLAAYDPSIENYRYAAPNKFYESLMLGKPLIMARGTGMSEIVEANAIGELIEFSKEGFIDGVNRLIARKDEWPMMGNRMKEIYRNQYCWDEMERRLIQLYTDLQNEENTDR